MKFESIIDNFNIIGYWPFSEYSADQQTVYPRRGSVPLTNTGSMLGQPGGNNTNFSSKSANLRNGQIIHPDFSVTNDALALRSLTIFFLFKTNGNPVINTTPIICKWYPENQYFIGFEDGKLIARIQTASGLVELSHDIPTMLYENREYWNQCFLRIGTSLIEFGINGKIARSTNASSLTQGIYTPLTVGGPAGSRFNENFFIKDLVILKDESQYFYQLAYRMTQSDIECWKGLAPIYLYELGDDFNEYSGARYRNHGYGGDYDLLVNSGNGVIIGENESENVNDSGITIPVSGSAYIDGPLTIDFQYPLTVMWCGRQPSGTSLNSSGSPDSNLLFDFRVTPESDSNRIRAWYDKNWSTFTMGIQLYNSSGSSIYNTAPSSSYSPGYGSYRIIVKSDNFKHVFNRYYETVAGHQVQASYGGPQLQGVVTFNSVKAFAFTELQKLAIYRRKSYAVFNHEIDDAMAMLVHYRREMLVADFMLARGKTGVWLGAQVDVSSWWSQGSPVTFTGTLFQSIPDSAGNRASDFNGSTFIPNSSCNIRFSTNPLGGNDITIGGFFYNTNLSGRYFAFQSSTTSAPVTGSIIVAINSKNGVYKSGSVEFTVNGFDSNHSVYLEDVANQLGFHYYVFVRRSTRLEIWVNGVLRAVKITPTVYTVPSINSYFFRGGPLYLTNAFLKVGSAWTETDINLHYHGLRPILHGRTIFEGSPIKSEIFCVSRKLNFISSTVSDDTGKFTVSLPRNQQNHEYDVVAKAYDDSVTNHMVVYGPYSQSALITRDEFFDNSFNLSDDIIEMDPVMFLKMDDTGSTLLDSSGNGNNATVTGDATYGEAAFYTNTHGIRLNGGHVVLPNVFNDLSGGFTFAMWVAPTSTTSNSRIFDISNNVYAQRSSSSSGLICNTTAGPQMLVPNGITNDAWKFYVYRVAPDGLAEVWLNGSKVAEGVQTIPGTASRILNFIGKSNSSTSMFSMKISHFAFYNYPLPDENIEKQCSWGFGIPYTSMKTEIIRSDPICYWPLSETSGLVDVVKGCEMTLTGESDYRRGSFIFNRNGQANTNLKTSSYYLNTGGSNKWGLMFSFKAAVGSSGTLVSQWYSTTDTGVFRVKLVNNRVVVQFNNAATSLTSMFINQGNWTHVSLCYDGSQVQLYVNSAIDSTLGITTINYESTTPVTLGSTSDDGDFITGVVEVDDVTFYDKYLASGVISSIYDRFTKKKRGI